MKKINVTLTTHKYEAKVEKISRILDGKVWTDKYSMTTMCSDRFPKQLKKIMKGKLVHYPSFVVTNPENYICGSIINLYFIEDFEIIVLEDTLNKLTGE